MSLYAGLCRALRAPGFAVAVMLLCALAVALNATAFSALWGLRYKPLPYANGDQLVDLRIDLRDIQFQVGLSASLYQAVRAADQTFAGAVASSAGTLPQTDQTGRNWLVPRITPDFDQVLGVSALLGRGFEADGQAAAGLPPLLLSERAWRSRFNADPQVLGQRLKLAGREHQIVGVMPAGFAWPDATADAWTPYRPSADETAQDARGGFGDLDVAARLAPGVSLEQGRAQLAAILKNSGKKMLQRSEDLVRADVRSWRDRLSGGQGTAMVLLQLAALLLLLVAAVNLANLLVDRMLARRSELALRRTLGARHGDLLRSLWRDLWPATLLGCALGLLLTPPGLQLLAARGLLPETLPVPVGLDLVTLLCGLAVTGVLLAVAALVARLGLRGDGASAAPAQRGVSTPLGRGRMVALVVQVAVCTVLAGGATLLLRSAWNLLAEPRGFSEQGVLLTQVNLFTDSSSAALTLDQLTQDLRTLPGVDQIGVADMPPFGGAEFIASVRLAGQPQPIETRGPSVSAGYFAALGIPVLRGRDFSPGDLGDASPVIVDEAFAAQWLAGRDPLASSLKLVLDEETGTSRDAQIVGVVGTVKQKALDEPTGRPVVYQLLSSRGRNGFLVTRSSMEPSALALAVQRRIAQLAPGATVALNLPLRVLVDRTLQTRRALLEAVTVFAAGTLALAGLGLYAVLAAVVRRRSREFGVRLAIGSSAAAVVRLVLRQAAGLVGAGVLFGLALGIPLAHALALPLFQLDATDRGAWAAAAGAVALIALLACAIPARRAARVAPRITLQE